MPRRREVPKREILPDPKFGNVEVAKFMNVLMLDGKKSVAESIVYGAFDIVQTKSKQDPVAAFHTALDNIRPAVEVRSRRVGGATYQVPVEVNPNRRLSLSLRWLVGYATARGDGKTFTTTGRSAESAMTIGGQRANPSVEMHF